MKFVHKINSLFDWLESKLQWTFWLYIVLALLVTFEVISRYVFKQPHDWFLEVAIALSVYCGFLGAGTITKERRHIDLDILYVKANPKWKRIMDMVNSLAGIIFSSLLCYFVIKQAVFLTRIDSRYETSLGLPYSVQTLGAAVGLILCILFFIGRFFKAIESGRGE